MTKKVVWFKSVSPTSCLYSHSCPGYLPTSSGDFHGQIGLYFGLCRDVISNLHRCLYVICFTIVHWFGSISLCSMWTWTSCTHYIHSGTSCTWSVPIVKTWEGETKGFSFSVPHFENCCFLEQLTNWGVTRLMESHRSRTKQSDLEWVCTCCDMG